MKHKILISFGIMIVLGLIVFAVADSISNTQGKIDAAKLTALKSSVGLRAGDTLNINYGSITCDGADCWSSVDYPNMIQTEWRNPKNHCSRYANETCEAYADYTNAELIQLRDEWVKNRLSNYADTLIQSKSVTDKGGSGTMTLTDK
jgi:hypothetical protein